ncbi:hypothetical protein [Bacillus subtilis]|uniref:hypothetical protein n=1 Tax=Bacillus subtilis TaxID=1423 RepID=UPI002AAA3462|nr:hypothetical protein [Bacillus subtilis]MDY7215138.1 hypothetical protein [Bacillus subtilis]
MSKELVFFEENAVRDSLIIVKMFGMELRTQKKHDLTEDVYTLALFDYKTDECKNNAHGFVVANGKKLYRLLLKRKQ